MRPSVRPLRPLQVLIDEKIQRCYKKDVLMMHVPVKITHMIVPGTVRHTTVRDGKYAERGYRRWLEMSGISGIKEK